MWIHTTHTLTHTHTHAHLTTHMSMCAPLGKIPNKCFFLSAEFFFLFGFDGFGRKSICCFWLDAAFNAFYTRCNHRNAVCSVCLVVNKFNAHHSSKENDRILFFVIASGTAFGTKLWIPSDTWAFVRMSERECMCVQNKWKKWNKGDSSFNRVYFDELFRELGNANFYLFSRRNVNFIFPIFGFH